MSGAAISALSKTGGLLLAGGRSQRFGTEKAVALFRGRPLMDWVADRFTGCATVALSARAASMAARHAGERGFVVLFDDPAHPVGPLAGICAGLRWASKRGFAFLAVAPCDAPTLPRDMFSTLLAGLGDDAPAAYAVTDLGEHPLCAVWRTSLAPALSAELASKSHPPVRHFLAAHGAAPVRFDESHRFANANTTEVLQTLEDA
jgi:molybdopterin-guanine dinucleotide biosynthesis protein A